MDADEMIQLTGPCDVLALGEPTHADLGIALARNELLPRLVDRGFRTVVLETDRVSAALVNDHVQGADTTLDDVMAGGFSHGFGENRANRELVEWLRQHNASRAAADCVSFHGFDAPLENLSVPNPRRMLEPVAQFVGLPVDVAAVAGPDEHWESAQAVMDPGSSPGRSSRAAELALILDELRTLLLQRSPGLVGSSSTVEWERHRVRLLAADHLLRYHRQAAAPVQGPSQMERLMALRDVLMAENLLDIVARERPRGKILIFAHNAHLQKTQSTWPTWGLSWAGAGAMAESLLGPRYAFIAGSLGMAPAWGLGKPPLGTYEALADHWVAGEWGVVHPERLRDGRRRDDVTVGHHLPLDAATLERADGVLHAQQGRAG